MVDDDHRARAARSRRRARASHVLGAGCAAAGLTALTACSGEVHDAPVLKLADSYSTTHMFARYGVEGFIEDVTAAGDGEVGIEYYPAGQLGGARDIVNLAQAGSLEIVPAAPAYLADQPPQSRVTHLPRLDEDSCAAAAAYTDLLSEEAIRQLEDDAPPRTRPL